MTDYVCSNCDYIGKRKAIKPGSGAIEWFLWLVLLFPGPIYSIWRILNKKYKCPHCGEEIMFKTDSVLGQRRVQTIEEELSHVNLSDKILERYRDVEKQKENKPEEGQW